MLFAIDLTQETACIWPLTAFVVLCGALYGANTIGRVRLVYARFIRSLVSVKPSRIRIEFVHELELRDAAEFGGGGDLDSRSYASRSAAYALNDSSFIDA